MRRMRRKSEDRNGDGWKRRRTPDDKKLAKVRGAEETDGAQTVGHGSQETEMHAKLLIRNRPLSLIAIDTN